MRGPKRVKYVLEDVDRHGNVRIYFRRKGVKARINETLWSEGFWHKYHELLRLSANGKLDLSDRLSRPQGTAAVFAFACVIATKALLGV
jgi:hypothetical protein